MIQEPNEQIKLNTSMSVISAGYLGPALVPNQDVAWDETKLPLDADEMVKKIMGQPIRRAGRFIKLVCCGALTCLQKVPKEVLKGKKIGIFLATGLGNVDEILPFIIQVFKHDGGFPSPNQFANSVSNAAAFFLARVADVKGVILTISEEELSFESALWLAQTYLESNEIDLALVGGCDVFTPTIEECHERINLTPDNSRLLPIGENSSWLLLSRGDEAKIGNIFSVELNGNNIDLPKLFSPDDLLRQCEDTVSNFISRSENNIMRRVFLPGFRICDIDATAWKNNDWDIDDYLPHCGISSTAAAYGLARAFISNKSTIIVQGNYNANGKKSLITAITK